MFSCAAFQTHLYRGGCAMASADYGPPEQSWRIPSPEVVVMEDNTVHEFERKITDRSSRSGLRDETRPARYIYI